MRLIKKKKLDLIVCYDPIFTGIAGVMLKLIFRCKLVIEVNNSSLSKAMLMEQGENTKTKIKIALSNLLRSISLSFADGIKVLSDNQRQSLKSFRAKKFFCFHDFVPTHTFLDQQKSFEKYILFIGFPFYRKGVDVLIKAFEKISKDYPDFRLKLIGHKLKEDTKNTLGIWGERIEFKKPVLFHEIIPEILNCYCLVLPSREEGMGRVLLEAMASGKPVIGSNVGGIPGLIKDGENGFLFESGNSNDLAEKLSRLLSDEQLARRMGAKALDIVNKQFSSDKYCHYFENMVEGVCND